MNNSNNLSRVEANLPPGFRFHPRDEELICDYLMKKIAGVTTSTAFFPLMIVVDLNKCEPWDIPETACVGGKDWYFFSQRDRKYASGLRTNRATVSGYWKATGKDREILRRRNGSHHVVGMRKTLVFYKGRAPKGNKTDWVMHEFRLHSSSSSKEEEEEQEQDWVICRVFHKKKLLEDEANKRSVCFDHDSSASSSSAGRVLVMDQKQQQQHDDDDDYDSISYNIINFQAQDQLLQVPCFSISNAAATTTTTTFTGDGGGPINDNNVIPHVDGTDDDDELTMMNSFFNTNHLLSHDHLPTIWN